MMYGNDTKDAQRGGEVLINTEIEAGIKSDQTLGICGRDPQSAYTPIVNKMKQRRFQLRVQRVVGQSTRSSCAARRSCRGSTARSHVRVHDRLLRQGGQGPGRRHGGPVRPMTFLPFEEANTNPTLAAFLKYVGKDDANGFAAYGWTATLAFKQAVDAIVKKDGVNGLTRANLLGTGLDGLTSFDAGGMIGTVDIKNKVPTACVDDHAAAEGQVRAAGAHEEGHVQLRQVERRPDQGRPDR